MGEVLETKVWSIKNDNLHVITDKIIVEQEYAIKVDGVEEFHLFCTPVDVEALAVGFLFSEKFINDFTDVCALDIKDGVVLVKLLNNLKMLHSSQGIMGEDSKDALSLPVCNNYFKSIPSQQLFAMMKQLQSRQNLFHVTGATHAAMLFGQEGNVLMHAEDVARHNAVDKVIGKCLQNKAQFAGCGIALSGRVSFELAKKIARAGIELIAAVSAPTSMAVAVCEQCNITLCGFVRENRLNIYAHPKRIAVCL
jgi:FdhD protein